MYDQFYGLNSRPFQLTPDPQYYFESGTHRKALSYLGYGLAQGEGFIVITGEVGAGKSTLVGHLMQTIDKARLTAAHIVTSQLSGPDMVQMTAESYGIDTRALDKAATLKAIENFLHAEARAGRRCLMIVDEAQNLEIDALEELRMLSNFQLGSTALLQIFLLGQPEFRDLVQEAPELEQLRQRVIATHHLEPMDADEVAPYVMHRLSCAGWNGNPQISDEAFAAIYVETAGVPRMINTLMNRILLMGAVEKLEAIDAALVGAVITDMAGKPFEYEAPLSSRGEVFQPIPEEITGPEVDESENVIVEQTIVEANDVYADEIDCEFEVDEPSPSEALPSLTAAMISPVQSYDDGQYADLVKRVNTLEKHLSEQDETLRRVIGMMIDWMDKESAVEAQLNQSSRAA